MQLEQLKVGQNARITGFLGQKTAYRHKLLAMGLTPGAVIQLIRKAPLGDPLHITCRGATLSLRQKEANILELELIP
jgi:ferrous iron transport protein A